MMNYISCELVKAEKVSMCRSDVYSIDQSDGTRGHSGVERFEKHFIPVDPNPELTKSEISVSQKMVDEFIAYDEVKTMGDATTVVRGPTPSSAIRRSIAAVPLATAAAC